MDLNIDNYSYEDLLNVLKITNNNSLENIDRINNLLADVQKKCSKEIVFFFTKAYNIVSSIFKLQQINLIDSVENFELINDYYYKIKNIKNLEHKKVEQIVSFMKDLQNDTYATSYVKILQTDEQLTSKSNRSLYNNQHTNMINDTLNNSIAPGHINSIKRITKILNLHMNSCFRSNYFQSNASDFQYIIPSEIKNVVSMQLVSLEVPHSWYLISQKNKNNFFKIMVTMIQPKCIESNEYTIEIPEGNYTEKTLEKFLNKTYFYESDNDNLLQYIRFYIDPYNKKTGFEILDRTVNISLFFSEETNENPLSTFGWLCGFRITSYLNIYENIISEGIFDNETDSYVYIVINDYQYNTNHMNIVGFDKSVLNENVIAKALLKKNSPIFLNNENLFTQVREYNGPVNISKLHIKLLNKFGQLIDLNNMDIGLTIQFETLYESFNFKNISS
jgi:hypothetical protein